MNQNLTFSNHTRGIISELAIFIHALAALVLVSGGVIHAAETEDNPKAVWNDYIQHLKNTKGVEDIRLLHDSGSGRNAFNLVVVSAGFRADEVDQFYKGCATLTRSLFYEDPWKKYKNLVNVYGVMVEDESPDNTRFQVVGHKGQVMTCQNPPAIEYANFAEKSDGTIVLHNSKHAIPTCGNWGVLTCNLAIAGNYRILHHELGHTVGGLGDTYTQRPGAYDGRIKGLWEGKNATDQSNPLLTQWHYWTQDLWPGIFKTQKLHPRSNVVNYEGAAWAKGFYRPEQKCVMHGGDSPSYCTICTEIMEFSIVRSLNLFEEESPPEGERVLWKGETENFHLKTLKFIREPRPWLLSRLELHVNGRQVASSSDGEVKFQFGGKMATPGYHQIGANLNLQSDYVRRDDGFFSSTRGWRIKVMPYEKPRLTLPPRVTTQQGKPVRIPFAVQHSQKNLINIQMNHAPDGATLQSGGFEWLISKPGAWLVDFTVSVDKQEAFTQSVEIIVKPDDTEDASIELEKLEPVNAHVNKQTTIQIKATASKGGQLLYQLLNPKDGMDMDRTTGKLIWTPRVEQYGPHRLRYRVSNGSNTTEGHVLVAAFKETSPYQNNWQGTFSKQCVKWIEDHKESPIIYKKIFELSRLLRDRSKSTYDVALEEMKKTYPKLNPGMREALLQEFMRHSWTFVDRPAILDWLTEISKSGTTENARNLQAQMNSIRIWRKVKDTELGGDPRHMGPLLEQLAKPNSVGVHSAIRRALKSFYTKAEDKEAFRSEIRTVMQKSSNRELTGMLLLLPIIEMPRKEEILMKVALDPDDEVSKSALDTVEKLTASSTLEEVTTFSKYLVAASEKRNRVIISAILKAICDKVNDKPKTQEAMVGVLAQAKGPGRMDLLQMMPMLNEPKLVDLLNQFNSDVDANLSAAARRILKYFQDEIGATDAFVASWKISGPYPMVGGKTVFAPETGETAEWKDYQSTEKTGPRTVPLDKILKGTERVAYLKTTIRSDKTQKVLFGAGSDDTIDVWLNGRLIHSFEGIRGVKPDQDQFTGTLKAGENLVLIKIKQFVLGWGACLSIRAENGGPAFGVSVLP